MAKLATQTIAFQISKAVGDSDSDEITILDIDALTELLEAVSAMAGDDGVIVELIK